MPLAARRKTLTTYEIMTLAVYLQGGELKPVDTEDVAIRANELAPGKFTWKKYSDQIDINSIMISLRHAKRKQNGALLLGDTRRGWRLSEAGLVSARRCLHRVERIEKPVASGLSKKEERWKELERKRLVAEPAYLKHVEGRVSEIEPTEAERFFKLDEYIRGDRRKAIVARIVNLFEPDPDLGPAIREIKSLLPGE